MCRRTCSFFIRKAGRLKCFCNPRFWHLHSSELQGLHATALSSSEWVRNRDDSRYSITCKTESLCTNLIRLGMTDWVCAREWKQKRAQRGSAHVAQVHREKNKTKPVVWNWTRGSGIHACNYYNADVFIRQWPVVLHKLLPYNKNCK